jgi:hypothetical protein
MKKLLFILVFATNLYAGETKESEAFLSRNMDYFVTCCECLCATSPIAGELQEVGIYPDSGSERINRKLCKSNEGKSCKLFNGRQSKLIYCEKDINLQPYKCQNVLKSND